VPGGARHRLAENFIHQVISILICDHVLLDEEKSYINEYVLRNRENHCFTDLLKVIILELPKVPQTEDSPVWPWLQFMKSKSVEDYKMLAKKYPEMKQATICAQKVTLRERLRITLFDLEMRRRDEREWKKFVIEEARKEARKEAREEARKEARIEVREEIRMEIEKMRKETEEKVRKETEENVRKIANGLRESGMPPEQIEAITGLRP